MKLKSILLTAAITLGLAAETKAQVPNYVPTNGLVGWWPFNGNANDESGNGNNGTVNGSSYSSDRFGNSSSSALFGSNTSQYISANIGIQDTLTFSFWYKCDIQSKYYPTFVDYGNTSGGAINNRYLMHMAGDEPTWINTFSGRAYNQTNLGGIGVQDTALTANVQWHQMVNVYVPNDSVYLYVDGVRIGADFLGAVSITSGTMFFGRDITDNAGACNACGRYDGLLDDIGIWNRALTQQEITDLYNATNCANNTAITPQINSLVTGNTATFTATTSDPNPSYVWQSNFGQGFQTLNNFGNYSGTNTGTLNITNLQLPNHTQPIRVITTSGNCIDTSNVAVINILDTCITNVTIYDTLLTTVTDTLIINTIITGIIPPNNQNTLKVFPNPANTHITIDYGNFSAMNGYTLKIVNAIGQTVFSMPINQQSSYIDLSTWTGNGIYYVQLIDTQNNTIENRKIVIQ